MVQTRDLRALSLKGFMDSNGFAILLQTSLSLV